MKDILDWLLSEENPPVRYLTLTRLMDRSPRSKVVREAKARLGEYGPTKKILARRREFWREGEHLYRKYRGGYWQLIFLGEYLAPKGTPGVREGVEFVLSHLAGKRGGDPWRGIPCLSVNLLRAMVSLGFGGDRRIREGLDRVAREVVAAKGVPCVVIDWSVYPTCHMTVPKVLLAMTSLPPDKRSPMMRRAASICVRRLLENDVSRYVSPIAAEWNKIRPRKRELVDAARGDFVRSRGGPGERVEKKGWQKFGFPLHYNSDVLEAMRALAQAGAPKRSPRVRAAVDLISQRRRPDGRWSLDFSLNDRMIAPVERRGQASRWITLHALSVLRYFRGLTPDPIPISGRSEKST